MKAVRGQAAEVGKLRFPGASLNLLPRGVLDYEHHYFVSSTTRSLAIIPFTCQLLAVGQLVRVGEEGGDFQALVVKVAPSAISGEQVFGSGQP